MSSARPALSPGLGAMRVEIGRGGRGIDRDRRVELDGGEESEWTGLVNPQHTIS